MNKSDKMYWFYHMARYATRVFMRLYCRIKVYGVQNLPRHGACIIAANHASYLDPPCISSFQKKRVVWHLARNTLAKGSLGPWIFKNLHCIMIDRDRGDIAALRAALRMLKEGKVVSLFPEGTRTLDGELQEAKGGVAFLIAKAKVPVVPVYLSGTFDAWPKGASFVKPRKVTLTYGEPIQPEELAAVGLGRDSYEELGRFIMSRIAALKPE